MSNAEFFKVLTIHLAILHDAFLMLRFPNDQNKVSSHLLPVKGILKTHLMNHAVYNMSCFFLLYNLRKGTHNPITSVSIIPIIPTLDEEHLLHRTYSQYQVILSIPIKIRALVSSRTKRCCLRCWKQKHLDYYLT